MISCEKAREFANGYIDGALTEEEACEYEEHISYCESCHEEYDMLKKIISDLSKTKSAIPVGFGDRLHKALQAEINKGEQPKEKKNIFAFPYYKAASVMAAALAIAVVGKFGIYDTYKNVTKDTADVANEIVAVQEISEPEMPDVIKYTEPVADVASSYVPENEQGDAAVHQKMHTVAQEGASAENIDGSADNNPPSDNIENVSDAYDMDLSATDANEQNNISMARMLPAETDAESKDDPATDNQEKSSSGGGGSSNMTNEKEEAVKTATELVPAEVTIYNNGDAAMIVFKKYLLTFLDGNKIRDNGTSMVITVTAEEYDSVMGHIRSNEYVKSVVEGVPFDGVAVINIK